MTQPEVTIQPLRQHDAQAAVELAARAFHDDPLFVHLHPNPDTRQRDFAREHAAYLKRIYLPVGLAEGAFVDRQLVGMALWLPPDAQSGLTWREWLCIPTLLRTVGLKRTRFMAREYGAFDQAWPADKRFHYLGLIAVDSSAQGRGVGSALLRAGVERADREGVGVYLETGTEANLAFYRKHGFEILQEIHLPTGPMHWAMWRPPAR
ncbi:MAG: GNAT family N-acetyltransferase [Rubricoccaceae bacterium]